MDLRDLYITLGSGLDWTDFTPQPYDCVYLPYLILSGPIVYGVGHTAMHRVDLFISVDDTATIRTAWNLIPGIVCLMLGGIQWWLIELAYIWHVSRLLGERAAINPFR
jgi:hypothetical protein